jgi:hypothetical protein
MPFVAGLLALALASACAPVGPGGPAATPTVFYRDPTYAMITPGPHKVVDDLSTTIEMPPFPYSKPLPPPVSTAIDGLYTRMIPMEGTPTPCKRCAGYRLEGGAWSLYFNNGVYKEFQQDTDFEAVGSYTVSGNQLTLFNDPYCEEDVTMQGIYTWQKNGDSLNLTAVNDPCTIGLRAKNLTATSWTKKVDECQPPNREAAVSGHWKQPAECIAKLTPTQ